MCGGSRGAAFVRRTCPKMENEAAAFLSGSIMWAQLVCVQRGAALAATVFVTRGLEATIGVRYALACAHVFTSLEPRESVGLWGVCGLECGARAFAISTFPERQSAPSVKFRYRHESPPAETRLTVYRWLSVILIH